MSGKDFARSVVCSVQTNQIEEYLTKVDNMPDQLASVKVTPAFVLLFLPSCLLLLSLLSAIFSSSSSSSSSPFLSSCFLLPVLLSLLVCSFFSFFLFRVFALHLLKPFVSCWSCQGLPCSCTTALLVHVLLCYPICASCFLLLFFSVITYCPLPNHSPCAVKVPYVGFRPQSIDHKCDVLQVFYVGFRP